MDIESYSGNDSLVNERPGYNCAVMAKEFKNFAGPLNLNKKTRQATTIMGTELVLGENDFEALYLFVSNEGRYLTFQRLYDEAWGRSDSTRNMSFASAALDNLVLHVNNVGDDFMWIDQTPGLGYAFKTCWGNKWGKQSGIKVYTPRKKNTVKQTPVSRSKPNKSSPVTLIAGVGTLVAALIMVFLLLARTGIITPAMSEPAYIEIVDPGTPLAGPDILEDGQ